MVCLVRTTSVVRLGISLLLMLFATASILRADDTSEQIAESDLARTIFRAAGVKGGLVVHLGCGDGKLTAALYARDSYLVHGLDADANHVAEARETIRSLKLYGKKSTSGRIFFTGRTTTRWQTTPSWGRRSVTSGSPVRDGLGAMTI